MKRYRIRHFLEGDPESSPSQIQHCSEVGECRVSAKVQPSPTPSYVWGKKKETPTLSSLSPVLELHGLCFKSLSTYECNNWYLLQQHFDTHLVSEFQKILVGFFFFEELIIKF